MKRIKKQKQKKEKKSQNLEVKQKNVYNIQKY